jgi:LPXTG-motif cell wall-anchored protein
VKVRYGLVALAVVLVAILSAGPAAAASVSMTDSLTYSPSTVTISLGDSVTWTNVGTAPHTVTADNGSFDSSPACPGNINACLGAGASYSRTFGSLGSYAYHCKVHGAAMSGKVVVVAAGTTPPAGGGGDLPNTGPGATTMAILVLGAALLLGGAALAVVTRRRA